MHYIFYCKWHLTMLQVFYCIVRYIYVQVPIYSTWYNQFAMLNMGYEWLPGIVKDISKFPQSWIRILLRGRKKLQYIHGQWLWVGAISSIHLRRINHLVRRDTKAILFHLYLPYSTATRNTVVSGDLHLKHHSQRGQLKKA